jgi:hypothetical protein
MVNHFLKYSRIASHLQLRMDEAELASALSAHYTPDTQHHWPMSHIDMIQDAVTFLKHLETILGLQEK